MPDMLVNLLQLPQSKSLIEDLEKDGIQIRRAVAPDKATIVEWVTKNSSVYAASEADVSFARIPVSCFIATRGKEIIGYACYNAIAPDFFGPTRVLDTERGKGIGKVLLIRSLEALRDEGYIYAIIGGVGPQDFYKKCVGAVLIADSAPGIYANFLGGMR